jgi:hypothetical protein
MSVKCLHWGLAVQVRLMFSLQAWVSLKAASRTSSDVCMLTRLTSLHMHLEVPIPLEQRALETFRAIQGLLELSVDT